MWGRVGVGGGRPCVRPGRARCEGLAPPPWPSPTGGEGIRTLDLGTIDLSFNGIGLKSRSRRGILGAWGGPQRGTTKIIHREGRGPCRVRGGESRSRPGIRSLLGLPEPWPSPPDPGADMELEKRGFPRGIGGPTAARWGERLECSCRPRSPDQTPPGTPHESSLAPRRARSASGKDLSRRPFPRHRPPPRRHSAGGIADASRPVSRRVPRSGCRCPRVWGRREWPPSPAAARQNWRSGFGVTVPCFFSLFLSISASRNRGPRFREGRGLFSPGAQVRSLVPRVAFHERVG
jgi:hypothetical protein